MIEQFRRAVVTLLAFVVLTGLLYPAAITAVAQAVMRDPANGSLIFKDGATVGSRLIGQAFVTDGYFHPRPSATVGPDPADATKTAALPYNAAASTGTNYGPLNRNLLDRVASDVAALRAQGVAGAIPVDLVTASASGLDPDISVDAALVQVPRVAASRGLPENQVRALVVAKVQGRALGFLGEPRVNVLALNLALDGLPH